MPITFACPGCGKSYTVPDGSEGKQATCKQCKNPMRVPGAVVKAAPPKVTPPPPRTVVVEPEIVAPPVAPASLVDSGRRHCPFCAEVISIAAAKCPHCREILDPKLRAATASVPTQTHITNKPRSSFLAGFGGALGCLAALAFLCIVGVVGCVMIVGTAATSVQQAAKHATERLEAEQQRAQQQREVTEAAIKAVADQVEVVSAKWNKPDADKFQMHGSFDITVKNNSPHPITRIYFDGTLASPGRSVPWHQGELNYEIPGGIEPGESKDLALEPGFMSDWSSVRDVGDDATLSLKVTAVDWPGMPK